MTDEEKFQTLKAEIESSLNYYADSVQGAEEDYSLSEFVTYLIFEVVPESERAGLIESIRNLEFELM